MSRIRNLKTRKLRYNKKMTRSKVRRKSMRKSKIRRKTKVMEGGGGQGGVTTIPEWKLRELQQSRQSQNIGLFSSLVNWITEPLQWAEDTQVNRDREAQRQLESY